MKTYRPRPPMQPRPNTPGVTRKMVRDHARRVFPDVLPGRSLTDREWILVEQDLVRRMENSGL